MCPNHIQEAEGVYLNKYFQGQPRPESISTHLRTRFAESPSEPWSDKLLEEHLYFLTTRFGEGSYYRSVTMQLSEFGKLYYHLQKPLFGNHLNRKRRQQALCYAFTDADGSRSGSSDVFRCEIPHVHALFLAPPKFRDEFKSALLDPCLGGALFPLQKISVEPFSLKRGSVEKLISYCMKGYLQARPSHFQREDLWAIFPR